MLSMMGIYAEVRLNNVDDSKVYFVTVLSVASTLVDVESTSEGCGLRRLFSSYGNIPLGLFSV